METRRHEPARSRSRAGWILIGFLGVATFFLVTEHTAHFFGVLPYLLLLLCPLMHLFMHRGHHGRGYPPEGGSTGHRRPTGHPEGHDDPSRGEAR